MSSITIIIINEVNVSSMGSSSRDSGTKSDS